MIAYIVGEIIAWRCNRKWPEAVSLWLAVRDHGGELRILLHNAHLKRHLVMVSLLSRKAYVGYVLTPPRVGSPSHVALLPVLSGSRQPDTLTVEWHTDYSAEYLKMAEAAPPDPAKEPGKADTPEVMAEDFRLVLPLDTIQSATYFDLGIWDRHFAPKESTAPSAERCSN